MILDEPNDLDISRAGVCFFLDRPIAMILRRRNQELQLDLRAKTPARALALPR